MRGAGLNVRGSPFNWFRSGSTSHLSSRPTAQAGSFPLHADSTVTRAVRGNVSHWDRSLKEPLVIAPSMIKVPANQAPVLQNPQVTVSSAVGGIKVVSVTPAINSPIVSVGLFIHSGSRNETHHTRGSSHFLKHLAFKSNKIRSALEQVRELEQIGASFEVNSDRDYTSFSSSFLLADLPYALSAVSGVLVPKLAEWEVNDTLPDVEREAEAVAHSPSVQLVEGLHREAFRGNGLANSLYAPLWNLHHLDNQTLAHFVKGNYRYDQAVLVGVGIPDGVLLNAANTLLEFAVLEQGKLGAAKATANASYVGGEARAEGEGPNHVALAYEGASRSSRDGAAFEVLQSLIGSSAVGVGRPTGLHSRVGSVLAQHKGAVSEGASFHYRYSDAGLFGAYLVGEAPAAELASNLQALFSGLKDMKPEEFETAKKRAKLRVASRSEGNAGYLNVIGQQALGGHADADPLAPLTLIDQVSLSDATALAARITSGKPTLSAFGDVSKL